ncbi:MAG: hypothetical protein ABSC01_06700 [Verrucomicrobiota bacterium]|jgi:hypothetical protein
MIKLKPIASLPIDPLESRRLCIVLATIVINVIAVALLTLAPWSDWKTGLALNLCDNALLLGFVVLYRDALLARLMIFGLATGFAELAADAWLVDYTRTLDYSTGGGPMLWRSPVWMPIAWEIVVVQFGCLGLWLRDRFGGAGLAAVGVLGAINISFYEEMAKRIHWWQYSGCRMISNTHITSSLANSASPSPSHCWPNRSGTATRRRPCRWASPVAQRSSFATRSPTASPTPSTTGEKWAEEKSRQFVEKEAKARHCRVFLPQK